MALAADEERALARIEEELCRSDPRLAAKLSMFNRLTRTEAMPERERSVLTMYYYDGMTLTEIGSVLGVTESRVCQIHTKALRQLRSRLAERPDVPESRRMGREPAPRVSAVRTHPAGRREALALAC